MKSVCLLSALFFFSLRAQAPVPLAHGDVPGEPHHHLKIENTYVRAYYVEVPPHGETQLHQHDHDYIFVTLGASDVTNAVLGKPEAHLVLKDGEVRFTRGGFAHVARNNSDAPFRNVTIELLHPQNGPRNLCEKIVDGALNDCPQSDSDSPLKALLQLFRVKRLFETNEILMTLVTLARNVNHSEQASQSARLLIVCNNSELRVDLPGESSKTLQSGEVFWLAAGTAPKITSLIEQGSSRFLLVSFKDSGSSTPAPKSQF